MKSLYYQFCLGLIACATLVAAENSTYINPVLPGWHSDPSCVQVDGTFYCVTSTFIAFPGLPVYASKDLINWRLISHGWNRESQLPGISWATAGQQEGMFAPTLRYREGTFYLICEYLGVQGGILGVLFKSTDPYSDEEWINPVRFSASKIDPDLFWDDDGKVYAATQGIVLQELDIETGQMSPQIDIWSGTGGVWPEGPHFYKRDNYYYLMIAEGGTAQDHAITIARARNIRGPYEAYHGNPILSNRRTNQYFQTVGHGDLFQDTNGNWWGMCLATRSGPSYQIYPMGREAVLFPVTWEEGEWPVLQPVRGRMEGWPMPPTNRDVPGNGPFNSDPDIYDFEPGTSIPMNLIFWRVPSEGSFAIAPEGGLQVVPSRADLTGSSQDLQLNGQRGLSFIGRRQTHSLFTFSVDLSLAPTYSNQEAGVTIFLTQSAHIDLGVVVQSEQPRLRFRATGNGAAPPERNTPIPDGWMDSDIRLLVETVDATTYKLSAISAADPNTTVLMGTASARLVSGGTGSFVGTLLGVYATCNGAGSGAHCPDGGNAVFKRWRYEGIAQHITETERVPLF